MAATDDFLYPFPISDNFVLRFTNALASIQWLYTEAGITKVPHVAVETATSSAVPPRYDPLWFNFSDLVIAGGILKLVQTITYPSPRGFQTITRKRVDEFFDGQFLTEYEDKDDLAQWTYQELDMCRFAFLAVMDLQTAKCFSPADGSLMPLAKRDIRKNCSAVKQQEAEEAAAPVKGAAAGPAAPSAGATAPPQKHLRGILEDECVARWPHTPVTKSVVFTVDKDPDQPKHKPLYMATVELTMIKKTFKGPWQSNKKDAENAAAEVAVRMLHTFKGK